jgi:nitric oxide synthase oxygenase domain/subunit
MDAEIGVRILVDPFRYNVLPELIKKMGLCDDDLDDLPDFERLALVVYLLREPTPLPVRC